MKDIRLYRQRPHSSKDEKGHLRVGAAIGAMGDYLERAEELIKAGTDVILIDIAHFDSVVGYEALANFRKKFPEQELVCGNIATREAAEEIQVLNNNIGIDGVKVGIGPGRGCRTRIETNFGVPQLQAIREVYSILKDEGIGIIADGGATQDGDIFLALACGATSVMLGSMLSGTDEAPGVLFEDPATKRLMKIYRGMTSPEAVMNSYSNEEEAIEALETPAEGQSVPVPYSGSVEKILKRIRGHLCSAVSYAGEETLKTATGKIAENPEKFFIPLSEAAKKESFER